MNGSIVDIANQQLLSYVYTTLKKKRDELSALKKRSNTEQVRKLEMYFNVVCCIATVVDTIITDRTKDALPVPEMYELLDQEFMQKLSRSEIRHQLLSKPECVGRASGTLERSICTALILSMMKAVVDHTPQVVVAADDDDDNYFLIKNAAHAKLRIARSDLCCVQCATQLDDDTFFCEAITAYTNTLFLPLCYKCALQHCYGGLPVLKIGEDPFCVCCRRKADFLSKQDHGMGDVWKNICASCMQIPIVRAQRKIAARNFLRDPAHRATAFRYIADLLGEKAATDDTAALALNVFYQMWPTVEQFKPQ